MFQDSIMRRVGVLVGGAAVVALIAYTYFAFVQARNVARVPVSITVEGKGEMFAKPDIATFSFSVNAREADAAAAQEASATHINAIVAYLTSKGVEEKDIKTTGYYLNPRYEYPDVRCTNYGCPPSGEPKLVGYEVNQSITVKVRKTEDAGTLISGVGAEGATNVGGLSFTIDDEDVLKTEARTIAIKDARAKADELAKSLGVRIVRMNGYWEDQAGGTMYGYGGDMAVMSAPMMKESSPQVPTGENTITSVVHISYEVR